MRMVLRSDFRSFSADWGSMLDTAKAQGFTTVRIYGAECNAFSLAGAAAKARGMKVLAGVYANSGTIAASKTQLDNDVGTFVSAVQSLGAAVFEGGCSILLALSLVVDTNSAGFIVGNEVNDSAQNIMNYVWNVRGYLNNVIGYHGPISSAHTWVRSSEDSVISPCSIGLFPPGLHPRQPSHVSID